MNSLKLWQLQGLKISKVFHVAKQNDCFESAKSEALNTYYVFAKSLQKLEMFHEIEK